MGWLADLLRSRPTTEPVEPVVDEAPPPAPVVVEDPALRAEVERYRLDHEVVDALPEYISLVDPNGVIRMCNRAYATFNGGHEPEELVGRNFLDLVDESARATVADKLARLRRLTPDSPIMMSEHPERGHDGIERWLRWTERAHFDEGGRIDRIASVGRDVTEEHDLANRAAAQAAELVDRANDLHALTDTSLDTSLHTKMQTAVTLTDELSRRVSEISSLSDDIGEVADQTNLLALNATIEAARAGEHGKGFSVVAGEVKSLASLTKNSVDSIDSLARELTRAVGELSGIMSGVTETTGDVGHVAESLRTVASALSERSTSLAASTER